MNVFDFIVVGADSSGCVLANRLSEDPARKVLLIEAGPPDSNPFIHMPKGLARTLKNPRLTWRFPAEHPAVESNDAPEIRLAGRTLGGSSAVNGMIYSRGQPQDYDDWRHLGVQGWGWKEMSAAFKAIEDHELGADEIRGGGGPLHVSVAPERTPLCAIEEFGAALDELARVDARLAQCVDLKFFCGFSFAEIAEFWAVSERTVKRDWDKARVLLHRLLGDQPVA